MQKISLIAQSVLELSHREKVHDDNDNDADTHPGNPGWIIVRDGMYSVADKKARNKERKNQGTLNQYFSYFPPSQFKSSNRTLMNGSLTGLLKITVEY